MSEAMFKVGDEVKAVASGITGKVHAVWCAMNDEPQYNVVWWDGAKRFQEWLKQYELTAAMMLIMLSIVCGTAAAGPAPTSYQIPLVSDAASDFAQKAGVYNTALTEAELATQNRVDAERAEVAAWTAVSVAKTAVQNSLLSLGDITSQMYQTHADETVPGEVELPPAPEPAPDDGARSLLKKPAIIDAAHRSPTRLRR
ncbi:MAG: hypothetical protein AB7G28_20765 [Pirellulales bacterium]